LLREGLFMKKHRFEIFVIFVLVVMCTWLAFDIPAHYYHRCIEPIELDMIATAYCAGECCCDEFADGFTASSYKIKPGDKIVAADSLWPFGAVFDVPGYGIATVRDRGGAIKGNKIDLLFDDHQLARNWGVQEVRVRIISVPNL